MKTISIDWRFFHRQNRTVYVNIHWHNAQVKGEISLRSQLCSFDSDLWLYSFFFLDLPFADFLIIFFYHPEAVYHSTQTNFGVLLLCFVCIVCCLWKGFFSNAFIMEATLHISTISDKLAAQRRRRRWKQNEHKFWNFIEWSLFYNRANFMECTWDQLLSWANIYANFKVCTVLALCWLCFLFLCE